MNILYIGVDAPASTSYHRALALRRLGHIVDIRNPRKACESQLNHPILNKIHFRTGFKYIQKKMHEWLAQILIDTKKPDLVWINAGELIGSKCLKLLKQHNYPVVLYNNDDPTGGRDGSRFDTLFNALPYYDLCAVMRDVNVDEYKANGAKNVIRVTMSYDESIHQPFDDIEKIPAEFRSKVAFIGTWMRHEKRDIFMLKLIKAGIPVSIWGSRWSKSPHWNSLKPYYRGEALAGRDYVAAIQGAEICIGMLSKGNRDLHTQRSLEVPYIGGLLCAERTSEHLAMYKEGEEAIFWNDADECISVCKMLLADDVLREKIRLQGGIRVRKNKVGNEDVCSRIINELNTYQLVQY